MRVVILSGLIWMASLVLAADEKPAPPPTVKVRVDTTEVPELAEWGKKAGELIETWHPKVVKMLATEGHKPPMEIRVVFKKEMKGVAYASGNRITIAGDWVKKHPEDWGMVVHEMTHTIQGYRRGGPGWLVEGIADHVRFFHFEPKTRITVNPKKASYKDGYRTTAKFLAWIEQAHDKAIISKLNAALRAGTYKDALFKQTTGKDLDALWSDFLAAQERPARKDK